MLFDDMSKSEIIVAILGATLSVLVVFIRYGIPAMIRYIAIRVGLALEEARKGIINERKWSQICSGETTNFGINDVSLSEAAKKAHIPLKLAKWAIMRHKIRKRILKWGKN